MTNYHDDLSGFGPPGNAYGHVLHALGPEVILSDDGVLSPIGSAGGGHGGGGAGSTGGHTTAPTPTLVTAGGNLAIDLVWDASVASAPAGFTSALIASAQALVHDLTTLAKTTLYIAVGWGEIAGQKMDPSALGESESSGYLTSYATVASALTAHGDHLTASNEPTTGQFFVTKAEAKMLGMVGGTTGGASSPDGYVGFSTLAGTGESWAFGATGTGASQFNLQSVVDHELTEVMGRISMEGTVSYNGKATYTPLDLFDFGAPGALALSNAGGYFSSDNGATHQGNFNNASLHSGDIGDWASWNSIADSGTMPAGQEDPFNAFGREGYDVLLSKDDLLVMAALGAPLTPFGQTQGV